MPILTMEIGDLQQGLIRIAGSIFTGILLTLILKITLDTFFRDASSLNDLRGAWSAVSQNPVRSTLYVCQFSVFIFTLVRFYLGAYRYQQEQPVAQGAREFIFNFIGAIAVFVALYVAGILIRTTSLFYLALVGIHLVDLVWFLCAMNLLPLADGLRPVTLVFITLDIITLFVLIVMGALDFFKPNSKYIWQFISLATILGVGIWDLMHLWPFYANGPGWQK